MIRIMKLESKICLNNVIEWIAGCLPSIVYELQFEIDLHFAYSPGVPQTNSHFVCSTKNMIKVKNIRE